MIPIPNYLTRKQAAAELSADGIRATDQTLADLAYDGKGPKFTRINGRILYRRDWLEKWKESEAQNAANQGVRRKAEHAAQAASQNLKTARAAKDAARAGAKARAP
jgi:hypothetical protein